MLVWNGSGFVPLPIPGMTSLGPGTVPGFQPPFGVTAELCLNVVPFAPQTRAWPDYQNQDQDWRRVAVFCALGVGILFMWHMVIFGWRLCRRVFTEKAAWLLLFTVFAA